MSCIYNLDERDGVFLVYGFGWLGHFSKRSTTRKLWQGRKRRLLSTFGVAGEWSQIEKQGTKKGLE
jgi:hypothetical protein